GIQAFDPVLVEGMAIRIHPLVCTAFNADFDGDQMAVHIPLSLEAQIEARALMMSVSNLISPANGKPIVVPTQDMVLGIYYLTKQKKGAIGEGMIFADSEDVRAAYDLGVVEEHAGIKARINGEYIDTTAGRVIFSEILPQGALFSMVNKELTKKEIGRLLEYIYVKFGRRETVAFMNNIERLGFHYATRSGISICINDMHVPSTKADLIKAAEQDAMEVLSQYSDGLITQGERYNKVVDIWAKVSDKVADEMMNELGAEEGRDIPADELQERRSFNSIFMMADSGARGSTAQIRQLAGMRGLMAKPSGEIIETPITANFREGLTPLQYFISTHGARKGLADTALKTANAGYLTRRLVDVAQDVIITEKDCKTREGIVVSPLVEGGEIIQALEDRIIGRNLADIVRDPASKTIIGGKGEAIDENLAKKIIEAGIDSVKIKSVLTCESKKGICGACYGRDLSKNEPVEIGEAVGIIAAQSIGEPGTQLTMRTFHIGGAATKVIEQATLEAKTPGFVKFINLNSV
ncbi:MAG: DNA-directed RNA polymerase subunit beta', partial [Nitrospirae bacterium]|nr:DNA-directed RNA polymerase subunit beta' [Nitrospirota bacterium]